MTGVSSNGAVFVAACWFGVNIYKTYKWTLFRILHQNRVQNIIQWHDNNIWKHICIKIYVIVLISIFDTTYKRVKQIKIYMWDLHHELVLFQKSRDFFAMYHIMISKGTSWAVPRLKPTLRGQQFNFIHPKPCLNPWQQQCWTLKGCLIQRHKV